MSNATFILFLGMLLFPVMIWAFKFLPGERWQIMASVPSKKRDTPGTGWQGSNITYYGFLLASGSLAGVSIFFLLLAAISIPVMVIAGLIGFVLLLSVMGAKGIARYVEKKKNTLTVAGAATTGLFLMPVAVWLHNGWFAHLTGSPIAIVAVMAALSVAYIIGEGLGRLACISFGCCYGRPVSELGPVGRRIFSLFHFTFQGATKKIIYASGLGGVKVVPIQAITSILYVGTGLVGMLLFLEGSFVASFALTTLFSMGWRIVSERWRADYRGTGKVTAYQLMGLVNICFCLALIFLNRPDSMLIPNLEAGLRSLWNPLIILFFQFLWGVLFVYTGVSRVTGATLAFHVNEEAI